jgi:heat-inducible transcriptional repressor
MLGDARLSRADTAAIDSLLGIRQGEGNMTAPHRLMEKVSHLLSETLRERRHRHLAADGDNRLQHIEFVQLTDGRILVVLVFAPNIIQNKIIRIDEPLTQDELERTARYLNAEFGGKNLQTIRAEILQLMRAEKALYDRLLQNAMLLCELSLEGEDAATGDVYVDGASNILVKPDFTDIERLRQLFRTLEEKTRLVKISERVSSRASAPSATCASRSGAS